MKLMLLLERKIEALLNKVNRMEIRIKELEKERDENKELLDMALKEMENS